MVELAIHKGFKIPRLLACGLESRYPDQIIKFKISNAMGVWWNLVYTGDLESLA